MGFSRLACPQNGILTIPTVQFTGYSLLNNVVLNGYTLYINGTAHN